MCNRSDYESTKWICSMLYTNSTPYWIDSVYIGAVIVELQKEVIRYNHFSTQQRSDLTCVQCSAKLVFNKSPLFDVAHTGLAADTAALPWFQSMFNTNGFVLIVIHFIARTAEFLPGLEPLPRWIEIPTPNTNRPSCTTKCVFVEICSCFKQ